MTRTWPLGHWKPRLRGETYCSPACGVGCTLQSFIDASERATALADELGKGWFPKVFESSKWYWGAQHPYMYVSPNIRTIPGMDESGEMQDYEITYTCFIDKKEEAVGGNWVGNGDTPREAVADALNSIQEDHRAIRAAIGSALDGLQIPRGES